MVLPKKLNMNYSKTLFMISRPILRAVRSSKGSVNSQSLSKLVMYCLHGTPDIICQNGFLIHILNGATSKVPRCPEKNTLTIPLLVSIAIKWSHFCMWCMNRMLHETRCTPERQGQIRSHIQNGRVCFSA